MIKSNIKVPAPSKKFVYKISALVLIVLLVIIALAGAPLKKVPADKIALSYGGGLFEGAQYQDTIEPGSSLKFNGFYDKWYEYPTTQRNFILTDSGEGEEQSGGIDAPDKNGVSERVELTVTFKLNTSKIRKFHESIGLKYKAWTEYGWNRMLSENFRGPLYSAVQQKLRESTTDEIRVSPDVIVSVQDDVEANLRKDIVKLLGDEYFCGPDYKLDSKECPDLKVSIKSITPPREVIASYNDQKTSQNKIIVATNNALAQIKKAKGEQASKDAVAQALTSEYLAYLKVQALQACAANSNCTLVVGGNDINVNTGSK